MKNIYEVMRQKEQEIQQLQKDIEALRVAARLLADESDAEAPRAASSSVPTPRASTAGSVSAAARPAETVAPAPGIRQFP